MEVVADRRGSFSETAAPWRVFLFGLFCFLEAGSHRTVEVSWVSRAGRVSPKLLQRLKRHFL